MYANERHTGRFRRTVSLSDDTDPRPSTATGVLNLRIPKHEHAQPRKIEVTVA